MLRIYNWRRDRRTERVREGGEKGIYGGRANVVCLLTVFLVTLQARDRQRQRAGRQGGEQSRAEQNSELCFTYVALSLSVAASLVFPMKLHIHTYIYLVYIYVGLSAVRGPQKAKNKTQFCHSGCCCCFGGTFERTLQIHGNPIYCCSHQKQKRKQLAKVARTSQKTSLAAICSIKSI